MYYSDLTKYYTVSLERAKHGRIKGKLSETFSFMVPTYPMPLTINYMCEGVTKFHASPR